MTSRHQTGLAVKTNAKASRGVGLDAAFGQVRVGLIDAEKSKPKGLVLFPTLGLLTGRFTKRKADDAGSGATY
jgi:hypothetical protein